MFRNEQTIKLSEAQNNQRLAENKVSYKCVQLFCVFNKTYLLATEHSRKKTCREMAEIIKSGNLFLIMQKTSIVGQSMAI